MKVRMLRNLAAPSELREGREYDLPEKEAAALVDRGLAVSLEKPKPKSRPKLETTPEVSAPDPGVDLKTSSSKPTKKR